MSEPILTTLLFSPAGSGKTESLARRYIQLLKLGVPPERILTITFTEKAAAEMKERIFRILKREDPELEKNLKENILKIRISTIDSFCLSLIKTFAPFLGLPFDLEVSPQSEILWTLSTYDTLMEIAQEKNSPDYELLLELIADGGFRGWTKLERLFYKLFTEKVRPERVLDETEELAIELNSATQKVSNLLAPFLKRELPSHLHSSPELVEAIFSLLAKSKNSFFQREGKRKGGEASLPNQILSDYYRLLAKVHYAQYLRKILAAFQRFLQNYSAKKRKKGILDFFDLEILALHLLTNFPDWQNILYAFDQHTDHILVDEFQDTSLLQWAIIDKLTEEWRSGFGAKRERNIQPTLFLVGDEKQSIYLFRNASSEIFAWAKEKLSSFLGDKFRTVVIKDNYRSLPAIISFTNFFFSRLFTGGEGRPPYETAYSEFEGKRKNQSLGQVEIILDELPDRIEKRREREARLIAQRIATLIGQEIVYSLDERPIPAGYEHFAILLRGRTHLALYEKALSELGIPYLVVKGVGFYDEPEVQILIALVNFLAEPTDDTSLYIILRTLFSLPERELLFLQNKSEGATECLFYQLKRAKSEIAEELASYQTKASYSSLAALLEEILARRGGWQVFSHHQAHYNIKKFIRIIENLQWEGKSLLEIKEYLAKAKENPDEPKADVPTEGIKAVRIMTIHAAKGLEFPIVFLAGLDENFRITKGNEFLLEEKEGWYAKLVYLPDKNLQREERAFIEWERKNLEEEKRIFYVGVTRARDFLSLVGIIPKKLSRSRLTWLKEILALEWKNGRVSSPISLPGLVLLSGKDVEDLHEKRMAVPPPPPEEKTYPEFLFALEREEITTKPVTKETKEDLRRHGEGAVLFGEVLHKILEKIARGELPWTEEAVRKESRKLFLALGLSDDDCREREKEILRHLTNLARAGLKEIVLPQKGSYVEMPFLLKEGKKIYRGRIDRVIGKGDEVYLYDYKTYPVEESEIPQLLTFYQNEQMGIYLKAAEKLFPQKKVKGYLIFTALGKIFPLTAP